MISVNAAGIPWMPKAVTFTEPCRRRLSLQHELAKQVQNRLKIKITVNRPDAILKIAFAER